MKSLKRRALALFLALAGAAACACVWAWFRPLDARDAWLRWKLWKGGVRRERLAGLSVLVRDTCGAGECRCVALVHGLGDSAQTWERLLAGDAEAGPVPPGLRLFAMDMPGTEDSLPPARPEGYGIREQARALRSALEPVCKRWTVGGNSLGGWIAVWLALEWPEGVDRLVLLAPAGLQDPTGVSLQTAKTLGWPTAEKMRAFAAKASFRPPPLPDRAWAQMARMLERRPTRRVVMAIKDEDFLEGRLGSLRIPVSLLWGEADGVIPPSQGARFRDAIPGARLEILPRCGHMPQQECPAKVAAALY